jgi:exosortase A-associated hydrolase 1
MNFEERALAFRCDGDWLYGILGLPEHPASRGVLIVVGGPQYRVGSHRQFTLLARHLAAHGAPVLRFDFRGMGDSEGNTRTFENVEDDLRCAIDRFFSEVPFIDELVIWGLCDAASASIFYAHQDQRIRGLVLANPWIRTEQGAAKAYLQHYYVGRLFDPQFWNKIRQGNFNFFASAQSLSKIAGTALAGRYHIDVASKAPACYPALLPERMFYGLSRFNGRVLLIISGNDLTAQEFSDMVKDSCEWRELLGSPRVSRHDLPEADHTFSRRQWHDQIANWTTAWIQSW